MITEPTNILLVDDLVTRRATFLGAASRIAEMYTNTNIKAFAAMRTISNGSEFSDIIDPRNGTIVLLSNGRSQRRP